MTGKQKRIVTILLILNITVMSALVAAILRLPPSAPPHTPTPNAPTIPLHQSCQWKAVQRLSQSGLVGTAMPLPNGSLYLEIIHPVVPDPTTSGDTEQNIDRAAQAVWTAFDVALNLWEQEKECASFTQVGVTILLTQTPLPDTASSYQVSARIDASASTADLVAYHQGELDENEFVERVTYNVTRKP